MIQTLDIYKNSTSIFERILITNDDGIDANGIKILEAIAREISNEVWVVAPEENCTASSHSVSLRTSLSLKKRGEFHYSVKGTPTDCVILAVNYLLKDNRPTLILSGINHGENLGEDITYSGTVGAACESLLLGIPAVALSLMSPDIGGKLQWESALDHGPPLLKELAKASWPSNVLLNVNFPNLPKEQIHSIKITRQGRFIPKHQMPNGCVIIEEKNNRETLLWVGSRSTTHIKDKNTDIVETYSGSITITPIHLDYTHFPTIDMLQNYFRTTKHMFRERLRVKDVK